MKNIVEIPIIIDPSSGLTTRRNYDGVIRPAAGLNKVQQVYGGMGLLLVIFCHMNFFY